ncbi:hypothetical protein [Mesorhizobium sp.]|uniref:hypothetical protein n=1 Tax=Mesorhizobium sp. TaxID=1871066 RepID=UPI0011FD2F01|nr:hypothetical protein [Mesorhizobium sp.]TIL41714.1 MAG: hypothetical protein E5Y86_31135 [Mesorhizobium sp.]
MNAPRYRIGAFVGNNFWHESYDAFGCTQQATNWRTCVPTVPTYVNLISQDNDWHSLRLGLAGQTQLTARLSLSGDVAFLFTRLDGKDQHHMRPKIKLIPEDGDGHGVQLEAVLNYKVTDLFNIGVGARYWAVANNGTAHFEEAMGGRGSRRPTIGRQSATACSCRLASSSTERARTGESGDATPAHYDHWISRRKFSEEFCRRAQSRQTKFSRSIVYVPSRPFSTWLNDTSRAIDQSRSSLVFRKSREHSVL